MVEVAGREVKVTNPDKVFFPERGETKLDLVHHYLTVGDGALRGVLRRPTVLKRFPDGATGKVVLPEAGPRQPRRSGSRPPSWPSRADAPPRSCAPPTWPT